LLCCEAGTAVLKGREFDALKGASHEIELGQIWYQKKELEKFFAPNVSHQRKTSSPTMNL